MSGRGCLGYLLGTVLSLTWLLRGAPSEAEAPAGRAPVSITGSAGLYGEVYSAKGRGGRRPSSTRSLYIRPTLNVLGMSFPFEVVISSEESRFRQPFNRFGVNPRWRWATFHAGYFSPRFSRFTASGITLLGGGIDLRPGIFRFSFAGGRSNRAVTEGPAQAYRRMVYAIKVGIGRTGSNFIDIDVVKALDDTSSVGDSISASPQENLVLGLSGKITLFKRRFFVQWDAAGSVHTRDIRNSEIGEDTIPESVRKFYKVRISTRADYAYRVATGVRFRRGTLQFDLRHIGPGFVSLGLPSIANDRSSFGVSSRIQVIRGKLSVRGRYGRSRDNLEDDKKRTTKRELVNLSFDLRPVRTLSLNGSYGRNTIGSENEADTSKVETYSGRYSLGGRFTFKLFGRSHSLSSSYSIQKSERESPGRTARGYDVRNFNLGFSLNLPGSVATGLRFGMNSNGTTGVRTYSYGMSARHRALGGRWVNVAGLTIRSTKDNRSLGLNVSSNFSITRSDRLNFNVRRTSYSPSGGSGVSFSETIASLGFDHAF